MKKGILGLFAGLLVCGGVVSSYAQSTMTPEQMMKKIMELEARIDELEGKSAAPAVTAPALEERVTKLEESQAKVSSSDFNVYWKEGLRLDASDKSVELKIGGRIFNDWYFPLKDSDAEAANLASGVADYEQDWGTQFRQARLYLEVLLFEQYEFKTEYEFAGGTTGLKDMYIGLVDTPIGGIRLGHFKAPFSLEEMTSGRFITFMERSLINTLAPARETGIMNYNTLMDGRMTYAVGFFKPSEDTADSFGGDDSFGNGFGDGEWALYGRVTGLPYTNEEMSRYVHLGLSGGYRSFENDDAPRFRARPEISYTEAIRLIDTGSIIGADRMWQVAAEAAVVWGPASLQGEFLYADMDRGSFADPEFMGYYVQGSYFLTGEHRPYKASPGAFERVKPKASFLNGEGGIGAWELALRYSHLDLSDSGIAGGEQDDITAGINWYLHPNYRMMWNYIYAELDDRPGWDLDESILAMRLQVDF